MPSENAKPVKKEEVEEDGDEMSLGSIFQNRKKKSNNATTSNGARVKKEESKMKKGENNDDFDEPMGKMSLNKVKNEQSKVKKEEYEDPTAKKSSNKTDKKKKKIKEEEKKSGAKIAVQNGKKREKKVYDLPGQKRDPPEERDPLRIFYESLYQQEPNSEMASFWMMESGLLPKDEAKKVYEKKLKRNQQQKLGSPMKAVVSVKKSAESITVVRKIISSPTSKKKAPPESKDSTKRSKKRKIDDDLSDNGSDDDFVMAVRSVKKQRGA